MRYVLFPKSLLVYVLHCSIFLSFWTNSSAVITLCMFWPPQQEKAWLIVQKSYHSILRGKSSEACWNFSANFIHTRWAVKVARSIFCEHKKCSVKPAITLGKQRTLFACLLFSILSRITKGYRGRVNVAELGLPSFAAVWKKTLKGPFH